MTPVVMILSWDFTTPWFALFRGIDHHRTEHRRNKARGRRTGCSAPQPGWGRRRRGGQLPVGRDGFVDGGQGLLGATELRQELRIHCSLLVGKQASRVSRARASRHGAGRSPLIGAWVSIPFQFALRHPEKIPGKSLETLKLLIRSCLTRSRDDR